LILTSYTQNDLIPDHVRAFDESMMKNEKSKPRSPRAAAHINQLHCLIKEVENYDLRNLLRSNERLLHAAVSILMDKAKEISLAQHIAYLGKNLDKAVELFGKILEMVRIFERWQSEEHKMERKRKRRDRIKESQTRKSEIRARAYRTQELREQGIIKDEDEDGLLSEHEPEEDRATKKQRVANWRMEVDQGIALEVQEGTKEIELREAEKEKENKVQGLSLKLEQEEKSKN